MYSNSSQQSQFNTSKSIRGTQRNVAHQQSVSIIALLNCNAEEHLTEMIRMCTKQYANIWMRNLKVTHHPTHTQTQNIMYSHSDKRRQSSLTPSMPAVPNCYCLKRLVPYWSNPPVLIFNIRALWCSVLRARVPKCQKSKLVELDQYGKV